MRVFASILVVLLAASLCVIAALASRLSRLPAPEAARGTSISQKGNAVSGAAASLQESLRQERAKTAELLGRIEQLEVDKQVLVQDSPAGIQLDKVAAFRAGFRRLLDIDARRTPADSADATEYEVVADFLAAFRRRREDPKTYASFLQVASEELMDSQGVPLTEAQAASLAKLWAEMGQEISRIPRAPAGQALLQELSLEEATLGRVNACLTDPQRALFARKSFLSAGHQRLSWRVPKGDAVDQIAKSWARAYELDPARLPAAKLAAGAYVDAMNRKGKGPAAGYGSRIDALREQLAALETLGGSLSPAERERLRTLRPREIFLVEERK